MSSIVEFAKTKNINLLIKAGNELENSSGTKEDYEKLILNHMGCLLGVGECEYNEALQFTDGEVLIRDRNKTTEKLEALSAKGYHKATKYIADANYSTAPLIALRNYLDCLDKADVDQGEVNEKLGCLYMDSDELESKEGIKYLKIAADQYNRGFAQYVLAVALFYGNGVDKNVQESYSYCFKAANNGDSRAEFWLGKDFLIAEEYPLEKNVDLGIRLIKRAADKFEMNARYFLGCLYFDGEFVEKDTDLAESYLLSAKYFGIPGAYSFLGQLNFERGDYTTARDYFETAYKEHGLLIRAESLVRIYKNGLGMDADIPKAIALIEAMIDNGTSNIEDVEFIADCYYEGNGVCKDIDQAVRYYSAIADNNPAVRFKLGCIAAEGSSGLLPQTDCLRHLEYAGCNGYPQAYSKIASYFLSVNNVDRALDYFKRSYDAGFYEDGVMVGRIYEAGTQSMYKNLSEAVKWYKVAAEKGSERAKKELEGIKETFFGYRRV